MQDEGELQEIVQLVGVESLSDTDRIKLLVARMIRIDFLQQNAFDDVDTYTSFEKQKDMLQTMITFLDESNKALGLGAYYDEIVEGSKEVRERISRMKFVPEDELDSIKELVNKIKADMREVLQKGGVN